MTSDLASLERLATLAKAATPGPWREREKYDRNEALAKCDITYTVMAGAEEWFDNRGHKHPDDARYVVDEVHVADCGYDRDYGYPEGGIKRREDAAYIAAASPDVVLGLIADLQALRAGMLDCFALLPPERVRLVRPMTMEQIRHAQESEASA